MRREKATPGLKGRPTECKVCRVLLQGVEFEWLHLPGVFYSRHGGINESGVEGISLPFLDSPLLLHRNTVLSLTFCVTLHLVCPSTLGKPCTQHILYPTPPITDQMRNDERDREIVLTAATPPT